MDRSAGYKGRAGWVSGIKITTIEKVRGDLMATRPDDASLSCLFLGLFVLAFGLCSRIIKEKLYMSEPLLSTLLGVLLSSKVLNILRFVPKDWDQGLAQGEIEYEAGQRFIEFWLKLRHGISSRGYAASSSAFRFSLRRARFRVDGCSNPRM
jgi:hypothetical protein